MASTIAALELGRTLEQARLEGLVRNAAEEQVRRAFEREKRAITARGCVVEVPTEW
jgi:hypothetical protein